MAIYGSSAAIKRAGDWDAWRLPIQSRSGANFKLVCSSLHETSLDREKSSVLSLATRAKRCSSVWARFHI